MQTGTLERFVEPSAHAPEGRAQRPVLGLEVGGLRPGLQGVGGPEVQLLGALEEHRFDLDVVRIDHAAVDRTDPRALLCVVDHPVELELFG